MARRSRSSTLLSMHQPTTSTQPTSSPDPGATTGPSVLIVDADRRVRASLAALLQLEPGVSFVDVAADVATAAELAIRHRPDVIVLDPRLPDVDAGLALLAFLRRRLPDARIVVCAYSDLGGGAPSLSGADAVLSKGTDPGAFVASILGREWSLLDGGAEPVGAAPFVRLPAADTAP